MRYWTPLAAIALCSCSVAISDSGSESDSDLGSDFMASANTHASSHKVNYSSNSGTLTAHANDKPPVEQTNLSVVEFLSLRELLKERNYEQLNQVIKEYQREYEREPNNEFRLTDAYRAFQLSDDSYQQIFVDWMDATPENYQPYLAAAHYHFQRGWSARGSSFMSEVSVDDKTRFVEELEHAALLIGWTLDINPDLMPAYRLGINIERSLQGYQESSVITDEAFKRFPDSLALRITDLMKYRPRWGGSYDLMHNHVENTIALHPNTEKFKLLRGYYYLRRSKYNMALERFDNSLRDINTAIELRPTNYDHYIQKGHVLVKMDQVNAALDSYNLAHQLSPKTQASFDKSISWAVRVINRKAAEVYKTNPSKAIEYYDNALLLNSNNHDAAYWRAHAFVKLKQYDQALEGFEHSIQIDPSDFDSHRQFDYILAKQQRWDEIIAIWDTFLALKPEHAGGYLERAGTHHHKGNKEQSRADLKRACELDSQQACAIVASLDGQ